MADQTFGLQDGRLARRQIAAGGVYLKIKPTAA